VAIRRRSLHDVVHPLDHRQLDAAAGGGEALRVGESDLDVGASVDDQHRPGEAAEALLRIDCEHRDHERLNARPEQRHERRRHRLGRHRPSRLELGERRQRVR
jgi:hypothetical protein